MKGTLWKQVITAIHGNSTKLGVSRNRSSVSGVWGNIISINKVFEKANISLPDLFQKKPGDGRDTPFWSDTWCCNEPLEKLFPRLAPLDIDRSCKLAGRIIAAGDAINTRWSWRRDIKEGREKQQLEVLQHLYTRVPLIGGETNVHGV